MCVCMYVCVCVYVHIYICMYIHHTFFIFSYVDGHLSCFHVLAIVNTAAMNIGVHVSLGIRVFTCSRYMPRGGTAGVSLTTLALEAPAY